MLICLIKTWFSNFFYKFVVFKMKFNITSRYIGIYNKIIKRLIFDKRLFLELLLFLVFYK